MRENEDFTLKMFGPKKGQYLPPSIPERCAQGSHSSVPLTLGGPVICFDREMQALRELAVSTFPSGS